MTSLHSPDDSVSHVRRRWGQATRKRGWWSSCGLPSWSSGKLPLCGLERGAEAHVVSQAGDGKGRTARRQLTGWASRCRCPSQGRRRRSWCLRAAAIVGGYIRGSEACPSVRPVCTDGSVQSSTGETGGDGRENAQANNGHSANGGGLVTCVLLGDLISHPSHCHGWEGSNWEWIHL